MRIRIWPILGICTVISRRARLDIVALSLACQTLEPEDFFTVLLISCYCKCSVAFPHGVVGLSGVYDCFIC